jgi:hypothetical protein
VDTLGPSSLLILSHTLLNPSRPPLKLRGGEGGVMITGSSRRNMVKLPFHESFKALDVPGINIVNWRIAIIKFFIDY